MIDLLQDRVVEAIGDFALDGGVDLEGVLDFQQELLRPGNPIRVYVQAAKLWAHRIHDPGAQQRLRERRLSAHVWLRHFMSRLCLCHCETLLEQIDQIVGYRDNFVFSSS